MVTYSNQKIVKIISDEHTNEPYSIINVDNIDKAMQYLTANTFKLWIYLVKNRNGYTLALSCSDVCKACGMSRNTFHNAVNELISTGYMVKSSGNNYNFYESVPDEQINVTINK